MSTFAEDMLDALTTAATIGRNEAAGAQTRAEITTLVAARMAPQLDKLIRASTVIEQALAELPDLQDQVAQQSAFAEYLEGEDYLARSDLDDLEIDVSGRAESYLSTLLEALGHPLPPYPVYSEDDVAVDDDGDLYICTKP